jgi:polysaccharide biosynthesis transport protein
MDYQPKQLPTATPAEYTNNGYGYEYSASGYGASNSQRSLNDYLLILRERVWYVVVVFMVVFSSALVYTLSQTKIYESSASIQVLRQEARVMETVAVVDSSVRGTEDLNTLVKVLESSLIIKRVADRITGEDLKKFMAPYEKGRWGDPLTPLEVLGVNRRITPLRLSLVVQVSYKHPDPQTASKVANMFMEEFLAWSQRVRIDETMRATEDLQIRVEQQRKRVEDLANELQGYREKNDMVSLDQRKDIITQTLILKNQIVTDAGAKFKEAEIRWNQVRKIESEGGDLSELNYITQSPNISQLLSQVSSRKIEIAQFRERYREKHPIMQQAVNNLAQSERELKLALNTAAASVRSQYEAALSNYNEAKGNLAEASSATLALDRLAVQYEAKQRDFKINEDFLGTLVSRMRSVTMQGGIDTTIARKVDAAVPSAVNRYISPKITLNIVVGLVGGMGLGLTFAFFVAFIDDRVKSSFDIESVVGLPLLGIIPQIKKMEQPDKAQIVVNNADRQVSEAFLTLHSSLRLRDESKDAKVILTTSTIPGEGKSFTTTNLALTYAAHGDKVCIIDCDLRKPNIHKSFRMENLKGVIDVCLGSASLDDVILKNVHPNLDVIPTGGRAKNPTQILNNKSFEVMISDLRKRYDRVFIDTPPLAAVSDAFVVLPLVDGSIFTIFFNKVRRKAAQAAARKLLESNVTCFGAVLNGLNLAVSGYYYAQYYDKSYKDYYVVADDKEPVVEKN